MDVLLEPRKCMMFDTRDRMRVRRLWLRSLRTDSGVAGVAGVEDNSECATGGGVRGGSGDSTSPGGPLAPDTSSSS